MSEAELREALQDKTLAEIAKDKGKSVDGLVKALVAAEEKTIDEAVGGRSDHESAGQRDQVEARGAHEGPRQRGAPPR